MIAGQPQIEMDTFQPTESKITGKISSYYGTVPREDIGSYLTYLNGRKESLQNELTERARRRKMVTTLSIGMIFLFVIFFYILNNILHSPNLAILVILLGVPYSLFASIYSLSRLPPGTIESEIRDIDEQIELIRCTEENHEIRAERRFRHHEYELKRYYDQTLNQSSKIFYVGIFSIISGLILIFLFSYWVTIASSDKIILGALGAIGSILSNYIAVIYGKMYKDTIESLNKFHNRLVTTHHLHYGALLSSQIRDNNLIDQTLSQMAINSSTLEPLNEPKDKSSDADPK